MYSIIGAGIGGLTTALAFEKLHIDYQVFEKSSTLNAVGAGIWLAPNALKVFEWLGILEQIKEQGNSIDRITLAKYNLEPLSDSFQKEAKENYGYSTIAIHRGVLQKILYDNLPKSKVLWNKSITHFQENESEVILNFEDNSTVKTDYLIAADGINSNIRKQLFPKSNIRFSGQTCWRGVTTHSINSDFKNRGIEMWGQQIRFGFSKLSKDTTSWFAVIKSKPFLKDDLDTLKQTLIEKFQDFHPVVNELIEHTEINNIIRNDIIDLKPLQKWHSNRVCLIGDAGHATTPNMGQGGAQAIEDAYFLAKFISENQDDSVFHAFQKHRFKKVNSIVNQSWYTGKIAHINYGIPIRNQLFKSLPKSIIDKKMNAIYTLE